MTNADSQKQWVPSHDGQMFTKSRNWVLRLVDGGLVLFVGGKVKIRLNLDGKSRPLIKRGVLWADITFRHGLPDAICIDGLPNEKARELEEAIAERERPYLFKLAYDQIMTWLQQDGARLAQCEKDGRSIPESWQATFEARRPHLELSDEDLWKAFRDPSVRAKLPNKTDYVESVLKIWRRDWPAYWAQKNEEHTRRELAACKDLFDQVESKPLAEEQARAVVCFDDHVLVVLTAQRPRLVHPARRWVRVQGHSR
ncbi:hypothetical protein [Paraburkholderia sediminicola]|uniref:hypothetical protein n=1 Tax=Paraburkholderia sediminicola TaxID=458836 RepID=UPI0038BD9F85